MQQRSVETRERILSSALSTFSESGYERTSVSEICSTANVSKGAFYYHFPSKQALFLELLESWLTGIDLFLQTAQKQTPSIPEALTQMAEMIPLVFQDAGGWLPMFLEFWTQSARDHEVWEKVIAPYRRYQDFFTGLIQAGIQEGSLKPEHAADKSARVIVALAVGFLLQSLMDPELEDWGQTTQEGIKILLSALVMEDK